jgi:hypothetical protein
VPDLFDDQQVFIFSAVQKAKPVLIGQAGGGFEVAGQISQLLVHGLPALALGEFFLLGGRQILLSGFLPVASGFSLFSFVYFYSGTPKLQGLQSAVVFTSTSSKLTDSGLKSTACPISQALSKPRSRAVGCLPSFSIWRPPDDPKELPFFEISFIRYSVMPLAIFLNCLLCSISSSYAP